jgi:hypothetical protein
MSRFSEMTRESSSKGRFEAAALNAKQCVHPVIQRAVKGTMKNRMKKVIKVAIERRTQARPGLNRNQSPDGYWTGCA